MVKVTIEKKEFDITEISYGDFMDIQDKHTVIDPNTGVERLLKGKATKDLALRMIKDSEGKAVDIGNKKQVSWRQGMLLDKEMSKYFDTTTVKNLSEEPDKTSQSLPTGSE